MAWDAALRSDIVDLFDEAQYRAPPASTLNFGFFSEKKTRSSPVLWRPPPRLTVLQRSVLAEIGRDPRVARAARSLRLSCWTVRSVCRSLVRQGLIRTERAENKRGSLLARLTRGGAATLRGSAAVDTARAAC